MKNIKKYIEANENEGISPLACFEEIGDRRDIVMFKNDGIRSQDHYSVVIISGDQSFETIRMDAPTLEDALRVSLMLYLERVSEV